MAMDVEQSKELYSSLAIEIEAKNADIHLHKTKDEREKFLSAFLQRNAPANRLRDGIQKDLHNRVYFLESKTKKDKRKKFNRQPGKRRTLASSEKKRLKLFDIKPEEQRFSMYLPLHQLWKDYLDDLIKFDRINPSSEANTETRLLRADYHGAFITVTRSKCPSLVGVSGIVVQETRNVFKIITRDDRLKTLPKENSVFTMQHSGYIFSIYGNQFCVRASDRVTKKFKAKSTVDL